MNKAMNTISTASDLTNYMMQLLTYLYYLYKFEKKISCTEKVNDIQNCQDELKKCG